MFRDVGRTWGHLIDLVALAASARGIPGVGFAGSPMSSIATCGWGRSGGSKAGPAGVDEPVPGPVLWEPESSWATGADDPAGDGEDPEPPSFGLPPSGW